MKVELLHIAGCPNTAAARPLLQQTLRQLGVRQPIDETEVSTSSQSEAMRFPGSPTIRIDGIDVEPDLPVRSSYGLSCRTYLVEGELCSLPTREMIVKTILDAKRKAR